MAGAEKKKKCLTIIPKEWPQFTGPKFTDGMNVSQANRAWRQHLKNMEKVGPTPRITRKF